MAYTELGKAFVAKHKKGNENFQAIKYSRKSSFFTFFLNNKEIGFQFEYNDSKESESSFELDLKIKKIFCETNVMLPSEFFGADNSTRAHFSTWFVVTTKWNDSKGNIWYTIILKPAAQLEYL